MNRNAGLRHGLFSAPITTGAVPEAGAPPRFMVPMHGMKVVGALHEPQAASLANEQVTHFEVHGPNACAKRKEAFRETFQTFPVGKKNLLTEIWPIVTLRADDFIRQRPSGNQRRRC